MKCLRPFLTRVGLVGLIAVLFASPVAALWGNTKDWKKNKNVLKTRFDGLTGLVIPGFGDPIEEVVHRPDEEAFAVRKQHVDAIGDRGRHGAATEPVTRHGAEIDIEISDYWCRHGITIGPY